MSAPEATPLDRLRGLFVAIDDVEERFSHGEPSWFVRGGHQVAMYADHHHDDPVAFWCDAPPGAQQTLVDANPDRFFAPPYVASRGWLGVYLDVQVDWDEVAALVRDAVEVARRRRGARRSGPTRGSEIIRR